MVVEDPSVADGGTHGYISSSLARYIHDGLVGNYVPPPSPTFGKIKFRFITKDEFIRSLSGINVKYSLQKKSFSK